jgi:hypothetical protein
MYRDIGRSITYIKEANMTDTNITLTVTPDGIVNGVSLATQVQQGMVSRPTTTAEAVRNMGIARNIVLPTIEWNPVEEFEDEGTGYNYLMEEDVNYNRAAVSEIIENSYLGLGNEMGECVHVDIADERHVHMFITLCGRRVKVGHRDCNRVYRPFGVRLSEFIALMIDLGDERDDDGNYVLCPKCRDMVDEIYLV